MANGISRILHKELNELSKTKEGGFVMNHKKYFEREDITLKRMYEEG